MKILKDADITNYIKQKKLNPADLKNIQQSIEDDDIDMEKRLTDIVNKFFNIIPALMAHYGNDVKILIGEMEKLIAKINDEQQKSIKAFMEAITKEEKPQKKEEWEMLPERNNQGFIIKVKIKEV